MHFSILLIMEYKLGIDIGGVIIDRINDDTDTSFFGENYLKTTAVPRAFESIAKLNKSVFRDSVYIISKCGEGIQRKSLNWLAHHRFYDITGIPLERIHFCRRRNGKGPISRDLGLTHFIDDRLEVLSYMFDDVEKLYLFKPQEREVENWKQLLSSVTRVENWSELTESLENEVKSAIIK